MEVFVTQTFNPNKSRGFTLLEVMVAGVLLMVFIIFCSQVFHQGIQQLQKRQQLTTILNHLDTWTTNIKQQGFLSDSLSPGWHQTEVVDSNGLTYQLNWHVLELTPLLKGITFQLQHPSDKTVLHEWKSGFLFQP